MALLLLQKRRRCPNFRRRFFFFPLLRTVKGGNTHTQKNTNKRQKEGKSWHNNKTSSIINDYYFLNFSLLFFLLQQSRPFVDYTWPLFPFISANLANFRWKMSRWRTEWNDETKKSTRLFKWSKIKLEGLGLKQVKVGRRTKYIFTAKWLA